MNRLLCTCGLAALLAMSAFAEPTPTSQRPPAAPAVQAVKKPAPKVDQITSSDDTPVKKPAAPAPVLKAVPAAPPVVTQKGLAEAAPAPASKIVESTPVKAPVVAAPASKITEAPAKASGVAAPASKITEAPAKAPVVAAPASKVTEAPAKAPGVVAPASKIVEAPAKAPVVAAPASKITEVPAKAAPASKIVEAAPAKAPVVAAPAKAAPTGQAAAPVKAAAAPAAKAPIPNQAPAAALEENLVFPQAKTELKRLMIGNQAGIVKVLGPNREGVSYARGIDDKNIARFTDDACGSIFCALGIPHERLNKVAREIMINYSTLPRKEAVALLGAIAASAHLDQDTDAKAEEFLVGVMETDKDVHARRQSVLALAVKHAVSDRTTEHVLGLFEHSENLWETFPVQQYFEYHALQVRRLNNYPQLRERIAAVKSLYTPAILAALDESKPVTAVPGAGHP